MLQRFLQLALISLISACCPCFSLNDSEGPFPPPLARLAVAHRGSLHTTEPENSLSALKQSIAAGILFLEVDVRLSDEGDLFIFHDGSLSWQNSDAPWELRGRKVQGLSRSVRESVVLDERSGQHIPSLAQALDVVRNTPATLQLDFKGESDVLVFSTLDLVRSRGQLSQVLLQIRSPQRIPAVQRYAPGTRIIARVTTRAELENALSHHVEFVELERWFSVEAVERAHREGAKVLINVSNSKFDTPSNWTFFRARGVDTIMTDHPAEALQ
jgi:glycerophosphoryl diester phosphodiesterase